MAIRFTEIVVFLLLLSSSFLTIYKRLTGDQFLTEIVFLLRITLPLYRCFVCSVLFCLFYCVAYMYL